MTITTRQAFEGNYELPTEFTQHDQLAEDALRKINVVQCYLDHEIEGGNEIAVLALDTLIQTVLHMTAASVARNKATMKFLVELFNENDLPVKTELARYQQFVDGFEPDGSVLKQAWI
jgi:hypothetical protein